MFRKYVPNKIRHLGEVHLLPPYAYQVLEENLLLRTGELVFYIPFLSPFFPMFSFFFLLKSILVLKEQKKTPLFTPTIKAAKADLIIVRINKSVLVLKEVPLA